MIAGQARAATFGKVVSIGGTAADLVLDEGRGKLYIANFTANRIDVMSLATNTIQTSINVPAQPSSVALSPDGHWLLVAHYGNNTAPLSPQSGLTLIDLTNQNAKQTFALGNPPLGVAFGIDNKALVVTTGAFIVFDPTVGTTTTLSTISASAALAIPVPAVNFPPNITGATVSASADYTAIYGMGDNLMFYYDVTHQALFPRLYSSSPLQAPRAVSVARDGSYAVMGWMLVDRNLHDNAEFPNPSGILNLGGHAVDSANNIVYSEVPSAKGVLPVLNVYDSDNLTVRDSIYLPEDLAGKGVVTNDSSVIYAISNSGVTVLPVGSLNKSPRIKASVEDVLFLGNYCDRGATSQTFTVSDPSGAHTPFTVSAPAGSGVTVTQSSNTTPATVTVKVDPNAFVSQNGTVSIALAVTAPTAVNIPGGIRVLVNSPQPNQRGSVVDVPGNLVDLLADNTRVRFYVLRQDKNQVQVFNGVNNTQIATLRTCAKPMGMAQSFDGNTLLVACDNAHIMNVFDLNALQLQFNVDTLNGYGQSVAFSNNKILAAMRDGAGGPPYIAAIDLGLLTAPKLQSLGVYQNQLPSLPQQTVLASSPNGSKILIASGDGHLMVYDANVDSFTASRQDVQSLAGPYAASAFDQFVVGQYVLDSSLATVGSLETATGIPSGFIFVNQGGYRTTAPTTTSPGIITKVDLSSGANIQPTPMVEAPSLPQVSGSVNGTSCQSTVTKNADGSSTTTNACITGSTVTTTTTTCGANATVGSTTGQNCLTNTSTAPTSVSTLTRTLALLQDGSAFVSLSTSGLVILPPGYAASVAPPVINAVVSAADGKSSAAPGGLITLFGSNLNPVNQATQQIPVPTALGRSCVTVNGQPMPLIFVSSQQINAQMPFQAVGNVVVVVHTPGGVSDNFNLVVPPNAPAVFLSGVAGPATNIPTVFRADNGLLVTDSDPVHRGDLLVIYLTGLGAVTPIVGNGLPGPSDPLAYALTAPVVTLGGANLSVAYAGLAPGEVGVYQINAIVPPNAPQGLSVPLVINQNGNNISLNVRVVQ
jgi:uncharacterized protein (TIGR03437 family)